jgi:hypothetical protein
MSKWRRFEVLLPVRFNDGREVPEERIGEAVKEIRKHFRAISYENRRVEGHWLSEGIWYQDLMSRIVVDVPDTKDNRKWMKRFKAKRKVRVDQLELWMVSYRIKVE